MALEDLTGADKFISNLIPGNPVGSDDTRDGDNHIRGIKNVLRNTFPNLNGAVAATDEDLSSIPGKVNRAGDVMSGNLMVLQPAPGTASVTAQTPGTSDAYLRAITSLGDFGSGVGIGQNSNRWNVYDFLVAKERMGIDGSNGNWMLNQPTAGPVDANGFSWSPVQAYASLSHSAATPNGAGYVIFNWSANVVGTITQNGTTGVLYNTSSDYRLKDIAGALDGAADFIAALRPVRGTWKADGSPFVGFLAHEFAEVSPRSVSGEKDAADEKGNPIYQSMQASSPEVMANVIAELQALRLELRELRELAGL